MSIALTDHLKLESAKAFPLSMSSLENEGKKQKILNVLSIFVLKRPDISYYSGMNHIAALLFSVFSNESDGFVMFCHIIENLFPRVFVYLGFLFK